MTNASASGFAASRATSIAARTPASLFSMVMGVGSLGEAWRAAARAYQVSAWVADALLAVSAALWLALFAAEVVKALTAPGRLRAELEHPVDGCLAALAPSSLLLLAAGIGVHSRPTALVLFWIGAAGALAFAVHAVGRWITRAVEPRLVTPAMYLPAAVGSLVAGAAAGTLGLAELGSLFLGAGAFAWILVAPTLLGRYLSAGELPAPIRPLLGLELAPPAFAIVALQAIDGPYPDAAMRTLLGISVFVALVLLRLAGRFREVPFTPAYWAFAFPLSALSTGLLQQAAVAPRSVAAALALPVFVIANGIVFLVAFRTVNAALRAELLPAD